MNLSKAQLAVAAVNRRRPAGAAPIIDPETKARSARPAERTLVFNEVVKQWTHADGRRVAELLVRQIRDNGDGTGAIGPDSKAFGAKRSPEKVYLRPWRHSGWHVSGSSPHLSVPRLASMIIPGARPDDPPVWPGAPPEMSLAEIVQLLEAPSGPARKAVHEHGWALETER